MKPKHGLRNESTGSRRGRPRVGILALVVALALVTEVAAAASGGYDPADDGYSMSNLTRQMGAAAWWDAGYTGAGIDVALIDTGVTRVPALAGPNKVVYGPDLSLDSQSPRRRNVDGFGHGTFMAGLIAGHGSTLTVPYSRAPATAYRGVAPGARIISVKVGASNGAVDVTQVIAAIDWVVQHAHDPGFDIRIISLSYGTDSTQPYTVDPLAYAAEQAWKHGIVVVAAAGNTGFQRSHRSAGLADPAYDPYVIGVGGFDTDGTAAIQDFRIGSYSAGSDGVAGAKSPDFVAPGSHLQGLRVPGSYIDKQHPPGILDALYMRGSGTSEATAVTAGAIALILQKYPDLTPDGVKAFIDQNAQKLRGAPRAEQGAGELDLAAMVNDAPQGYRLARVPFAPPPRSSTRAALGLQPPDPPTYMPIGPAGPGQSYPSSNGSGTLNGSRGSLFLTSNGKTLSGQFDIFGRPFDSKAMASAEASESSWSGGTWNGSTWSGNSWSGNSWSGSSWSGNSWSGNSWSGNSWSGNSWSSGGWSDDMWLDSTWS